jgi:hypothetical protein
MVMLVVHAEHLLLDRFRICQSAPHLEVGALHTFGMARMYSIAAERQGQAIGVFRARSDAEEWLGL